MAVVGLLLPGMALAAHPQGGTLSWVRTGATSVRFTLTTAWRANDVGSMAFLFGDGTAATVAGGQVIAQATDLAGNALVITRAEVDKTYRTAGSFTAGLDTCCRLTGLVNASYSSYRIKTVVDLRDPANAGSSVTSVPLDLQLAAGGLRTFTLPSAMPGSQGATCRLATSTESGISTVPTIGTNKLSVSPDCVLRWDTTGGKAGQKYAVQVMLESNDPAGGEDLTRSVAEFLIELTAPPTTGTLPACNNTGTAPTIRVGRPFSASVVGTTVDPANVLTVQHAGLPKGAALAPDQGASGSTPLAAQFSWTPPAEALGKAFAVTVGFKDTNNLPAYCSFAFTVVDGPADGDGDGVLDDTDNCPAAANPGQEDLDADLVGDACDSDVDGDGLDNTADNCFQVPNPDQADFDRDGAGDACDGDDDADGVGDDVDNCISDANPNQENNDGDQLGDVCDPDDDNDGVSDVQDTCALVANALQSDYDGDRLGDVCDPDDDNDGVADGADNCQWTVNPDQLDLDADAMGDVCDLDDDNDFIEDAQDNCVQVPNTDQSDLERDGLGDVCDPDDDNDGVADVQDNCAQLSNPDQANYDGDVGGNVCDADDDNDGVEDAADNCAFSVNADQADLDADGQGDVCDPDVDGDGVEDALDNCPVMENATQADLDADGSGDACDPDDDGDELNDVIDNCPRVANASQADLDGDGMGDACDADDDNDGVLDAQDSCPLSPTGGTDANGDGCRDELSSMCALIMSKGLPAGVTQSLCTKLPDTTKMDATLASRAADAFIREVKAQRGKKIPAAIADELLSYAQSCKRALAP